MPGSPVDIGKVLMDKYSLKILASTTITPKSVPDLSMTLRIPIASCYRKVKALEKLGLLECVGTILTNDGKRVRLYKSKASSISIEFAGEKLRIVIKFPEKVQKIETEVL
ncbi:MAG: helix-turn-helix transcriptional regulator [Deltaproteobacteria bacterium]|nr:helix-turn-helix transcriptional regulator [Deltaproteobacteria bacterium]MCD6158799.1 helix-turn-helix transcriptional regulator [Euryarchaeota archaeon]RLF65590.1 MAG: transcriptional regulator [Thermoplasmata archaeon]